jgi:HEAT repeat protein
LLIFCALLLVGVAWLANAEGRLLLRPGTAVALIRSGLALKPRPPVFERLGSRDGQHLLSIAKLIGVTFLTVTLIDYQFKLAARAEFHGAGLAAFFSGFYAVTGLLALVTQVLGTRRVLDRLGLLGALAFLPLGLFLGSGAFLVVGSLWAAAISQACNVTFRYTINDASVQMLYLPLSASVRGRAKTLIEGIEKPAAIALAALFLLLYQQLGGSRQKLSWVALGLLAIWLWLLWETRKSYLAALQQTLRRRRLDLDDARVAGGGEAAAVLRRALASSNPSEVAHALELLPHVDVSGIDEPLVALLHHPSPSIRRLAVVQVASRKELHHSNLIFQLFEDPDPSVRAAALRAFCGMAREKAVRNVSPFLGDQSVEVRAAAIAGLIQHGGLDGILTSGPGLKAMLASSISIERCWGARVLGEIGVKTFYQPLVALLGDPDLEVRRAALRAAGSLGSPELAPALIYRLSEASTAADAADALASLGKGVAQTLEKVLRNSQEDRRIRLNVPRVLARLATPAAARILYEALEVDDEHLRTQVLFGLSRIRRTNPTLPPDWARVERALDIELVGAHRTLVCAQALELPERVSLHAVKPGSPEAAIALLSHALDEQRLQSLERVLLLLGLLHPRIEAANLRADLFRVQQSAEAIPTRRAAALELLDNLLPRSMSGRLVPLWETGPRDQRLEDVAAFYLERPAPRASWLGWVLSGPNPWVRSCALNYLGYTGERSDAAWTDTALTSEDPRVREAALTCIARLASPLAPGLAEGFLTDPDPGVRRAGQQFSAPGAPPAVPLARPA